MVSLSTPSSWPAGSLGSSDAPLLSISRGSSQDGSQRPGQQVLVQLLCITSLRPLRTGRVSFPQKVGG